MKPAPFEYVRPASVPEALAALASDDGAKVIAGGQSLVPLMALRLARPTLLVDVNDLGLDGVDTDSAFVRIGASTRHRRLERDPVVARAAPLVREAAGLIGYPAIRTRGTIGGSLAHADPVAELPAVLFAAGGTVVARNLTGTREIAAADLFAGFLETTLAPDELVEEIRLPMAGPRHGSAFCEWAPREGDFAVAGIALTMERDSGGLCAALGAAACGVASVPVDCSALLTAALGEPAATGALLREIARTVRTGIGGDDDRADLLGLLAARASHRVGALGRVERGRGVKQTVKLEVNEDAAEIEVEPRDTLLDALRERLGLTGAHAGCEQGACGACTVLLDGEPARACLIFAVQCENRRVTTIEHFGNPAALHPMMEAFRRHHGLQCGFCTPAMVLTAITLLEESPHPSEAEVRTALAGNLCRCTGYAGIVDAVLDVAGSAE